MNTQQIWNCEKTVTELLGVTQPDWIEYDLTAIDIASICNGGCASGSYMPAVTYSKALRTMADYGDEVLQYIDDVLGEMPRISSGESWSGICCLFLSMAVELWAGGIMGQLEELELEGEA